MTAAVDDVLCRIEERHCRLFGPGTADLSPQHIEEVLALTGGDVDATARLLVDFRGASTKEVVVACDQPDDPQCAVCWSETKDTMIEPCGHLICHRCFDTIRQARSEMRRKCPFCRGQIGGARPALLRSEVRASVLPGGADDGDSGGEVEAGMVKSGPLVRSLSEIETAFGILCDMGDEEEEVEEIDLEEARRTSVVSIASVAQHSD